jgi:aldose 1-epimerase
MAILELANEHLRVEIIPEAGASVLRLAARIRGQWLDILRPTPPDAIATGNVSRMASFTLAPFSNRLWGARFAFRGRRYQLTPNTPDGHAQHGDVRRRPWRLVERSGTSARLTLATRDFPDFNYPFPFGAEVRYTLAGASLATELRLDNVGENAMPAGFGFHPYFNRALLAADEDVELQARATSHFPGRVPNGPAERLPAELDFATARPLTDGLSTCHAGWDGHAVIRWPGSRVTVNLDATPPLRHLVVFTPAGEPFFAVEPVSNATNGFNLHAAGIADSGTIELEPGASVTGSFTLCVLAD